MSLIRSFGKYYNVVDMHNTQNVNHKKFKTISNYCNFFVWMAAVGLIVLFYFDVTEIEIPLK